MSACDKSADRSAGPCAPRVGDAGDKPPRYGGEGQGHSRTSRRAFLQAAATGACAACASRFLTRQASAAEADDSHARVAVRDARWFERLPDKAVKCQLCPRECTVADVERGYCGVRENRGGDYKTLVYGTLCSLNIDPIEKKPLFHYLPGTTALSVATPGCNMECKFCQNWNVSQYRPEQIDSLLVPPENLARMAQTRQCRTIAYTYTEPVVFSEYVLDASAAARGQGVGSAMISNGYIREPALRDLCRHLTAVKVDLKAFTEKFYAEQCAAKLAPVLSTLEVLHDIGIHTEIVVLVIPTLNDSADEIGAMAKWIVRQMGPDVPVHFSRFHPMYRVKNLPSTPVETLDRARKVSMDAGLRYVYVGNVPFHAGESTYCTGCGKVVIKRVGYNVDAAGLRGGACASCGRKIAGVWSQEQALRHI
ncbi:MAG: AmmeMemoRadiSam system radical SAM enzyme [Planctomycetota bacterium]|nr:AmmeMemoRadiSam system radical SAM enzyme [Planctomycetota bacterium]